MRLSRWLLPVACLSLVAACTTQGAGTATSSDAAAPPSSAAPRSSPSASPEPTTTPTPSGPRPYELLLVDGTFTTPAICATYRNKIAKYAKAATGRIAGGKGKTSDAYVAADYRRSHPWVKDPMATRFEDSMDVSAHSALDSLTGGQASQAESLEAYRQDSIAACGLGKAVDSARAKITAADNLGSKIVSKAKTRPWYPRGYFDMGEGLAGRFVHVNSDPCYSVCKYWTLDVYTADGCPDGVYVEVNISRGGRVVDWTNDSLPSLRPHQTGRLEFVTYEDGLLGGEIADVSCY